MKLCTYCGSHMNIHQDHIKAKTNGGTTTIPACAKCNQSKGAKGLMNWFRWLKKENIYRWLRIVDYQKGKRGEIAQKVRIVRSE